MLVLFCNDKDLLPRLLSKAWFSTLLQGQHSTLQYSSECDLILAFDKGSWWAADINKRFVQKTPVHKLLNSYYKTCYSAAQEAVAKASSARKQMHPAFVLDLTCPLSEYDITFEASKTIVEFNVRGSLPESVSSFADTSQNELLVAFTVRFSSTIRHRHGFHSIILHRTPLTFKILFSKKT